jgi:hypothetical protein
MIIQINKYDPIVYAFAKKGLTTHQWFGTPVNRLRRDADTFTAELKRGYFDSKPYNTDTDELFLHKTPESYLIFLRYLDVNNIFYEKGEKKETNPVAGGNKRNGRKSRRRTRRTRRRRSKTTRKN